MDVSYQEEDHGYYPTYNIHFVNKSGKEVSHTYRDYLVKYILGETGNMVSKKKECL